MGIHILVFKLLLMAPLSTVGKKIEHEEHLKSSIRRVDFPAQLKLGRMEAAQLS